MGNASLFAASVIKNLNIKWLPSVCAEVPAALPEAHREVKKKNGNTTLKMRFAARWFTSTERRNSERIELKDRAQSTGPMFSQVGANQKRGLWSTTPSDCAKWGSECDWPIFYVFLRFRKVEIVCWTVMETYRRVQFTHFFFRYVFLSIFYWYYWS